MARYIRIPREETKHGVYWDMVDNLQFEGAGKQRHILITYKDGSTEQISFDFAHHLYGEVENGEQCEDPCYRNWTAKSAPTDPKCLQCRLAELIKGESNIEVRKPCILPWERPGIRIEWFVIAGLLTLLMLITLAQTGNTASPTPAVGQSKTQAPAR